MEKQVVLITGGNKGIGAACARLFGEKNYRVAIHYRSNPELAQELVASLPEAKAYCYDLSTESACSDLIKAVKEDFGRIDVLVNNAGRSIDQVLPFAKPDDFSTLIDSNLKSVFLLSKIISRIMIKQKSGSIINMTSVVGHTGNFGQSMYAATKSAINGLTMSIAQDLAGYGIRCNCVAPGFIDTAMTDSLSPQVKEAILAKIPLKRLGSGQEVAEAVEFLASPRSSYITGSTIHVNGGMFCN